MRTRRVHTAYIKIVRSFVTLTYELIKAMVEYARENGIKILPLCPFAKGRFERISEYADVLHQ
ncbi:GNAT family N-acetyltransferase [Paenibacillus amylolyticus]|uniref:GNAT family N-acetyltransferase n=1 Tax=Paenibacillus amylolyticus TaxID=1451 RepID=UPI003D990585